MLKVRWNILDEESRVVKAILDIAAIPRIFQPIKRGEEIPSEVDTVENIKDLKRLGEKHRNIQSFFGRSSEQQSLVNTYLQLYQKMKRKLELPIIEYSHIYQLPLPEELLKTKLTQLLDAITELNQIISQKQTKFICGNTLTVIDLLFYFHLCNMVYFKRNPSDYPNIMKWFGRVYNIQEVKTITHQWFSMAKQITRNFGKIRKSPKL